MEVSAHLERSAHVSEKASFLERTMKEFYNIRSISVAICPTTLPWGEIRGKKNDGVDQ